MTKRKAELGELETLIMLAVLRLGPTVASARLIREEVATRGGRELSRGATYATISRLEKKGFLGRSPQAESASGGSQHCFEVTPVGLETLRTTQQLLNRMRAGLESLLDAS